MAPAEVAQRLHEFLNITQPADVLTTIPSGSGICTVANIGAKDWVSGFISTREGRWNEAGQPTKYYANDFRTCAAELFGTDASKLDECVCEQWQTTGEVAAFDVSKFPKELQQAFYEDKGVPPDKWEKPHLLLSVAAAHPNYSGINSVYAPSASGIALGLGGLVFAADPLKQPLQLVTTGTFGAMIQ